MISTSSRFHRWLHLNRTAPTEALSRIAIVGAFLTVWVLTFTLAVWALSRNADATDCGATGCSPAA